MSLTFRGPYGPDEDGLWTLVEVKENGREEWLRFYSREECFNEVQAAREAEAFTLEERLGPYGLEWERERGMR